MQGRKRAGQVSIGESSEKRPMLDVDHDEEAFVGEVLSRVSKRRRWSAPV